MPTDMNIIFDVKYSCDSNDWSHHNIILKDVPHNIVRRAAIKYITVLMQSHKRNMGKTLIDTQEPGKIKIFGTELSYKE